MASSDVNPASPEASKSSCRRKPCRYSNGSVSNRQNHCDEPLDDDGESRTVDSGDVNQYIREITQQDFSAKDFRTWAGTVLAALALTELKKYDSQAEAKRNVVAAIESVSKQLGNTPAICRKCYVHPEVLNAYMSGDLVKMIEAKIAQKFKRQYAKLTSDEIMVLAFLRKRLDALK